MAFIPLPNGIRVKWSGLIDAMRWSSRVFVVGSVSPTATICGQLVTALGGWATADWAPVTAPSATIDLIEAQDWSVHLGVKAEASSAAVGTLSSATGSLPSAIAGRIDLIPSSGGFRHPGALFHTGIDLSQTTGTDTLSSGAVTALDTAYTALVSALNAAVIPAFDVVMASFVLAGVPRAAGVPFTVVDVAPRAKLATQVRRLRSVR
jgi:hypothetical protein